MPDVAELLPYLDFLLAETGDLLLLCFAQNHRIVALLAAFQFGEVLFRFLQSLNELLFFLAIVQLSFLSQGVDPGKGSAKTSAATDADEVVTSRQTIERVNNECSIRGTWYSDPGTQQLLHLYPELILQQVCIGDNDDIDVTLGVCQVLALSRVIFFANV